MEQNKPDIQNSDLRNFGILIASAVLVWWLYGTFLQDKVLPTYPLLISFIVVMVAIGVPRSLYYPYRTWMWFGEKIGAVMSKTILSAFFFLILAPMALIRKMFVKDLLKLRWTKQRNSYFESKTIQPPSQFERMF